MNWGSGMKKQTPGVRAYYANAFGSGEMQTPGGGLVGSTLGIHWATVPRATTATQIPVFISDVIVESACTNRM